jgi:hypothetical protein
MPSYYARVCWNSRGWVVPSGDAKNLETGTYAATDGFGHEEWLFNFAWLLDGYHYAFLQGVNNSWQTQQGQTIEVLLWSIAPGSRRVYIGKIANCEVLSHDESREAYDAHRRAGWLRLMREDLLAVNGNIAKLSPDGLFNIRFRPKDAVQYDDPLPVASPADRISKLTRYKLVAVQSTDPIASFSKSRQGSTKLPQSGTYYRGGSKGAVIDPHHPVLQKALMDLLQKQFGVKNVIREDGWVDLTVRTHKRKLVIELKTDPIAKRAIREALGQILEYAYYRSEPQLQNLELFIVAPGPLDAEAAAYLKLLNNKFGLPMRYCQFLPDGGLPDDFLAPL